MKQILLFDTALNTSNLGDEIIYEDCKRGLSSVLDNALIFRMGTHVVNYSSYQLIRMEDKKIKKLCDWADYKFICGTNLLTNNLWRVNPQWMVNPINARLYKDSILVGVGKTSNYDKLTRYTARIYNKILSKDYKHSVRDEDTKRVLEQLGYKSINTGCPTLWMFTEEKCSRIPTKKAENVVFTVSGQEKHRNPEKDLIMVKTLRKNYKNMYLWVQTVMDERYYKELAGDTDYDVIPIYSIDKYKNVLQCANVDYIGTRLHGGVFAMQNEVRSMVIAIDHRARGFNRDNNIPILERNTLDEEKLEEIIYSDRTTNIQVDFDAVNEFLMQFE